MEIDRVYPILFCEAPQAPQCKHQGKEKNQQRADACVVQGPESHSNVSTFRAALDHGPRGGPMVLDQHRVELPGQAEFLNQVPDDLIYPTGKIERPGQHERIALADFRHRLAVTGKRRRITVAPPERRGFKVSETIESMQ